MKIPSDWTFKNIDVANNFDEHVREQLPWYELATGAAAHIARHYIPDGGLIYDVGSSTGNIESVIAETIKSRNAKIISIDNSKEMISKYHGIGETCLSDAESFDYQQYDVAFCFLVLMFIPVKKRAELVATLRSKLNKGGAIIIFDKTISPGGYLSTVMSRLTLAGKVSAGVDPKNIIEKELSLAGVQRPISADIFGGDAVEVFRFGEFAGWVIEG